MYDPAGSSTAWVRACRVSKALEAAHREPSLAWGRTSTREAKLALHDELKKSLGETRKRIDAAADSTAQFTELKAAIEELHAVVIWLAGEIETLQPSSE